MFFDLLALASLYRVAPIGFLKHGLLLVSARTVPGHVSSVSISTDEAIAVGSEGPLGEKEIFSIPTILLNHPFFRQ